ncbi:type VI secretion-associated protein, TagC family [Serratia marcescens]|nr:type VI secretion-associated protein, TagC family [Serratia marcescens]
MYKSRREHQKVYANARVTPLQLVRSAPLAEQGGRKVVTLAADANGGLYVDGMRAHSLAVATSCLVQPLAGDRVCVIVDGDKLVITEILSRQQANAVMTLDSRCANLRIVAPEIELQGGKRLTLRSPHFTLLTRSSRWVAETLHQISQRLFVRSKHASRRVEETDELLAKHIIQDARQSLVINSEIGSLKSSAVLKIDGGQIHMG